MMSNTFAMATLCLARRGKSSAGGAAPLTLRLRRQEDGERDGSQEALGPHDLSLREWLYVIRGKQKTRLERRGGLYTAGVTRTAARNLYVKAWSMEI